ncbi:hypothetical protein AUP68_13834 [Ilyonectria robusta]
MAVRTQIATVGNRGRHSSNPSDPFNLGRPGGSLMDPTAPNPFATPDFVTPAPSAPSQSSRSSGYFPKVSAPRRRFKSSRLVGEFEKPWLEESKRTINWDAVILYTFVLAGLGISAVICWLNVRNIPNPEYCLVLEDNFETFNKDVWSHEVQMNGFGTGSFDWTTSDPANSYVDARGLHIVPTLTLESTDITYKQLTNGYTVNLTKDGTCTSREQRVSNVAGISQPCSAKSNSTKGTIINPVRSARLTTAGKKTIKYGRVEVVAKMPRGDWMWPAIWMMPQDSVYGDWPRSGEIDIAELRGNDAEEYPLGNNIVTSALHWGTSYTDDAWNKSAGEWGGKRTKYSDDFHLYSLEWSEKYLFTWLDGRLRVSGLSHARMESGLNIPCSKSYFSTSRRTKTCGHLESSGSLLSTAHSRILGAKRADPTLHLTRNSTSSSTLQLEEQGAGFRTY